MKKVVRGILFLVLIASHFWYLDRFPIGMNHDELEYVLSAKTYFLTGADLSNSHFPKSIFQTKTEGVISFLPALVLAPYFGWVPMNQFTARLPYVVINLATAVSLYYLVKKLFKDENASWLAKILFLINPWSFYLSRTATDTAFSLLFFILGVLFLIDDSKKKQLISLLFFILGFFSYHGAKVIFLPLILIGLTYGYTERKISLKNGLIILTVSAALMVSYFVIGGKFFSSSVNKTRSGDIWILNQELLSTKVDTERREAVENRFTNLFSNKITVATKIFFQKYLTVFRSDVLFNFGDMRGTYRFGDYGLFYLADLFFVVFGVINLFKKRTKETYFWLALVLISPLATAISGVETSVINRSFLLLPILIVLVSFGVFEFFKLLKKRLGGGVSWGILVIIYLGSFLSFGYFYFFRFPITGQENYFFSQRLIAGYTERVKDKKIVIIGSEPREILMEMIFYRKEGQSESLKQFVQSQKLELKNVSLMSECPKNLDKDTVYIIERTNENCLPDNREGLKTINEEQFGGPLFYIINDNLCSNFELQPWLRFRWVKNYLIEKLDDKDFCQNWIKEKI